MAWMSYLWYCLYGVLVSLLPRRPRHQLPWLPCGFPLPPASAVAGDVRELSQNVMKPKIQFLNPSNAKGYFYPKRNDAKIFEKHLNPVMFGIHWKALAKYFPMVTHLLQS